MLPIIKNIRLDTFKLIIFISIRMYRKSDFILFINLNCLKSHFMYYAKCENIMFVINLGR